MHERQSDKKMTEFLMQILIMLASRLTHFEGISVLLYLIYSPILGSNNGDKYGLTPKLEVGKIAIWWNFMIKVNDLIEMMKIEESKK